ncbi:hypothetical protein H311_00224 [Anncaliia algerae PRA109]|nr:hypothetical protein H311_00224 [Anncaliia algerae PRA109]
MLILYYLPNALSSSEILYRWTTDHYTKNSFDYVVGFEYLQTFSLLLKSMLLDKDGRWSDFLKAYPNESNGYPLSFIDNSFSEEVINYVADIIESLVYVVRRIKKNITHKKYKYNDYYKAIRKIECIIDAYKEFVNQDSNLKKALESLGAVLENLYLCSQDNIEYQRYFLKGYLENLIYFNLDISYNEFIKYSYANLGAFTTNNHDFYKAIINYYLQSFD